MRSAPHHLSINADETRCPICAGIRWVCENHPDQPWDEGGCQCGAGMPCACNQADWPDEPDTSAIIESRTPQIQ